VSKRNVVKAERVIPSHIEALLGAPLLLRSEDPEVYNDLLGHFAGCVEPKDIIEWFWVKDITDHTWEIRRLRRFKSIFVEGVRTSDYWEMFHSDSPKNGDGGERKPIIPTEEEATEILNFLQKDAYFDGKRCGLDELCSAIQLSEVMQRYEALDRLIASAERRRDRTLREIAFRREYLAQRLRKASDEIIGQFQEVVPLAAEEAAAIPP
jgi:hypothetical protein